MAVTGEAGEVAALTTAIERIAGQVRELSGLPGQLARIERRMRTSSTVAAGLVVTAATDVIAHAFALSSGLAIPIAIAAGYAVAMAVRAGWGPVPGSR